MFLPGGEIGTVPMTLEQWRSRNWMHLIDSPTARVRSRGDGTPPCKTWPNETDRASKRPRPSSDKILVITSLVYVEEDFSDRTSSLP